MKIPLAVLSLLVMCACANCPDPLSYQAQAENEIAFASYNECMRLASVACEKPAISGGPGDPRCQDGAGGPTAAPEAIGASINACEAYSGDDPCAGCVAVFCCAETASCFAGDPNACACNLAKTIPGVTWPASAPCDPKDNAFEAAISCLSAHCPTCLEASK